MGPEKIFLLPRVYDSELYLYNTFYKYLYLHMELVEMEAEALSCLDLDNLDDLLINKRNLCLMQYETDNVPELT